MLIRGSINKTKTHTWCKQMCMKWLWCPRLETFFYFCVLGPGLWIWLEEDITWPIIANTSRDWLSLSLPFSFSVSWILGTAPTLVSEARGLFSGWGFTPRLWLCLFVLRGEKTGFWFPNCQLRRVCLKPQRSSSSFSSSVFFRCSFY